jgi:hypothetical protein
MKTLQQARADKIWVPGFSWRGTRLDRERPSELVASFIASYDNLLASMDVGVLSGPRQGDVDKFKRQKHTPPLKFFC